ncbi:MAG: hypothetical protein WC846_02490 [Candidatus Gracilibacteria bacterium]|jgi:hypothetical protein
MNLAQRIVDKIPTSILLPPVFAASVGLADHAGHSHLLDLSEQTPIADVSLDEIRNETDCFVDDIFGAEKDERPVPEGLDLQGKNAYWVFIISLGVLFPLYGLRSHPKTAPAQDIWHLARGPYRVTLTKDGKEKTVGRFYTSRGACDCENELPREADSRTDEWKWNEGWDQVRWI